MKYLKNEFESIYTSYSDKVYSYIYMLVKDSGIAEELTQETFIKVYYHIDEFQGDSTLYTWITRIARNVSIDFIRKNNRFQFLKLDYFQLKSTEHSPTEVVLESERTKLLYSAIKTLKLSYQEVLILRKIKGFSIKEVAIILGWDETKVKNTTSRAMSALKKEILKRGVQFEDAI